LIHGLTVIVLAKSWVYLHCLGEVTSMDGVFICKFPTLVLYECETWFLTLKKEHKLRMSENRILLISRRNGVSEGW
jgi:hypothetical protein